jgi:D-alanine-D-alanine ligase
MAAGAEATDLSVLLFCNLDPAWLVHELEEAFRDLQCLVSALEGQGHPVALAPLYDADLVAPLHDYDPQDYIVLNWCEEVPGLPHSSPLPAKALEALNFTYTGSPPEVLARSEDKRQVKEILAHSNVPTPRWRIYEPGEAATLTALGDWDCFPAIVKPALEHCSFGITPHAVVMTPAELCERLSYVFDTFHQPALVEDYIAGREFHVSLWGNGTIEMLPPVEIDFSKFDDVHEQICSYDFKYNPSSIYFKEIDLMIADLSQDEVNLLEQSSLAAYHAVGCRDYARLDVRLQDGVFYVIDVNPNACLDAHSSMGYAARMAGYSYGALGSHLVKLAATRHPILGNTDARLRA